jgi:hypothetical protein
LKHLRAMTEAEIRRTSPPERANVPQDFWKNGKLGAFTAASSSQRRRQGRDVVHEIGVQYRAAELSVRTCLFRESLHGRLCRV